jgi:hypothetical protein
LLLKLEVTRAVLHAEPPRRASKVSDLAQKDVEGAAQTGLLNRSEGRVAMAPNSREVGDEPTRLQAWNKRRNTEYQHLQQGGEISTLAQGERGGRM